MMARYVLQRLLHAVPVLLVSSVVVFSIIHFVPGDPAVTLAGPDATADVVDAIRQKLNLDRSVPLQYWSWIQNAVRGDFGDSYITGFSVTELIARRIPATLELAVAGLGIALLVGVPAGILAAVRIGKPVDWLVSSSAAMMIALPAFWIGILAILVFSLELRWLPPGGRVPFGDDPLRSLTHILLPAAALSINAIAVLARFTRSSMLDTLGGNYVRMARAKGLSTIGVIRLHALRNALIPVVTIAGIIFGRMIAGAIVIEVVFAWPGMGRLLVTSIARRDYAVIQGILLLIVVFFVVVNLIVDLLYGIVDPRVKLGQKVER